VYLESIVSIPRPHPLICFAEVVTKTKDPIFHQSAF
jgi:hypothetical protein